jgi:glycerol-3-phosphate dehydrogenase (NAD(P)+)
LNDPQQKTKKVKPSISIGIIGGGSWATAITKILCTNGYEPIWWLRQAETVEYIRTYGHNPKYLSSVQLELPEDNITFDLDYTLAHADRIILGVPSYYLVDTLQHIKPEQLAGKKIITAIKGIIQDGHLPVSEYMHRKFGVPLHNIVNISGPCHAEEVAAEKLSYLTFASPDAVLAEETAQMFSNRFMRTSWCTDLAGTEYASVLKNIYAIAAGMSIGLNYGDNFRAILVAKAMEEMELFLAELHDIKRNVLGAAYLGDTLVTAYSQFSRNRTFGLMIGKGYTVESAILELNMVAEGYYSTKAVHVIQKEKGLNMPIAETVHNILYEKMSAASEFKLLSEKLG